MGQFDKVCEECDEEFSSFIETICDSCHEEHEKSVHDTIDRLKKHKDDLFNSLTRLREAQKAYMADRGNNELGKAVGKAAAFADNVLVGVMEDDRTARDTQSTRT